MQTILRWGLLRHPRPTPTKQSNRQNQCLVTDWTDSAILLLETSIYGWLKANMFALRPADELQSWVTTLLQHPQPHRTSTYPIFDLRRPNLENRKFPGTFWKVPIPELSWSVSETSRNFMDTSDTGIFTTLQLLFREPSRKVFDTSKNKQDSSSNRPIKIE